ncbi:MAG: YCF48-related protein [bacterium]
MFASLVFGVSTFLAHYQEPRPDPYQTVQPFGWDWWKYPIETNAFKRLPIITSNLSDVFPLPNSEKVWAVGDEGLIVHSEDGGQTWVQQYMNWEMAPDNQLTAAARVHEELQDHPKQAPNFSPGARVGQKEPVSDLEQKVLNISKHPANAPSEEPESSRMTTSKTPSHLQAIHFVDAENGWAVGTSGTIIVSRDGGQTWEAQMSGTTSALTSVRFIDAARGWVVGVDGTILATHDGGQTWQAQASRTTNRLRSVHFINRTTGWVAGGNGMILATRDGGQAWQAQTTGISTLLTSVYFIDATTGWAVGDFGIILATRDGGQTWQAQETGIRSMLRSAAFIDAETGWVVGYDGTILATHNGGKTWQAQTSWTKSQLHSIHFRDAATGWAVGDRGTIIATPNSGETWHAQAGGMGDHLSSIQFIDATTGWVAGMHQTLLITRDGGKSWRPVVDDLINTVHFVDASTAWAIGSEGGLLVTRDGGQSWQSRKTGAEGRPNSIHFFDPFTGWLVGRGGTILATRDGGQNWQAQVSGTSDELHSVYFLDAMIGWVVGENGTILATRDGGRNWQAQTSGAASELQNVYFLNDKMGWAVGEKGTMLATLNAGEEWQVQMMGVNSRFRSVHFIDAQTGWVVGDKGAILVTRDGGQSWQMQSFATNTTLLTNVFFLDSNIGWGIGKNEAILKTTDGGQTWQDYLHYGSAFAPWYYLTWLFLAPLLYLAFRRPEPIEAEKKSVADMLVSDKPISLGDPDPLDFNSVARGLSRYLRNENTLPPLTLAITGEWGSGKSSLMNLLKADLQRYGFHPVGFNAWHHQKEEHLLAALLQNIRKQALPRWWRPAGMSFRARLFWGRVRRYRLLALLLLAFFAVAVGYFSADHPNRLQEAVQEIERFFIGEEALERTILDWLKDKLAALGRTSVLALLSSIGAALLMLWHGLRAFGLNPASLMVSLSSNFKLSEAKARMDFRHDFAREFSEVTAALNPRTMLIFIDDLDRCRPENVLEVLEAVNFLVSSGDCFVVMGLDLHRVERCVGLGFKDVADELVDQTSPDANSEKGDAKKRRAAFARQYLEKLINLEVPVPRPGPEQSQGLIIVPEPVAPEPRPWWENLVQKATPVMRTVFPWILATAVAVGGFWLGLKKFSTKSAAQSASTLVQQTTPELSRATSQTVPSPPSTARERPTTPADSARGMGRLIQPVKEPASFILIYIVSAIILVLAIWRLSIPADLVVKDSPEFIDALKIWHPLLMAKHNTPRSVKRFVNRVRYFAMRQSATTETRSAWQRSLKWIGRKLGVKQREKVMRAEQIIPESLLVALSAIQHFEPDWVERICHWESLENVLSMTKPLSVDYPMGSFDLQESLRAHITRFGDWPPGHQHLAEFLKISAGVRMN